MARDSTPSLGGHWMKGHCLQGQGMAGTRTSLWFSCVWKETPGPSPPFFHETPPSTRVTPLTSASGSDSLAGGDTCLPHLPQVAGTDVVHGCAAGTPLARQVLAPLTPSSCQGAVWGIPFARAVPGHRQRSGTEQQNVVDKQGRSLPSASVGSLQAWTPPDRQ